MQVANDNFGTAAVQINLRRSDERGDDTNTGQYWYSLGAFLPSEERVRRLHRKDVYVCDRVKPSALTTLYLQYVTLITKSHAQLWCQKIILIIMKKLFLCVLII